MNKFFNLPIANAVEEFKTNLSNGLTQQEAEKRLQENGENKLTGEKERTKIQMFFDQFKDFLVVILIIASVISIVIGILEGEGIIDGVIIMAIVILNAILGVIQENRASNALKALKEMSSPQSKVLRDKQIQKVDSKNLVVGDIVILEAGDYIPADLRLIETVNLKVDESSLTGESVAVEKDANSIIAEDAGIGDQLNSGFMSSVVTYGRGKGIVTATGMGTQMGNIANMLNTGNVELTPLQRTLNQLGKILGITCIVICALIFVLGIVQGQEIMAVFMTAVSLAVAAIPEGMTMVVTVVLALGMQKMAKKNAIVKRLSAVEALGSTTVICSDKTGTLTQNKMTVVRMFDGNNFWDITGTGYKPKGSFIKENDETEGLTANAQLLVKASVLCSDAEIHDEGNKIIGDPTEAALIVLGAKAGMSSEVMNERFPRIDEIPFDSDRKLMSTIHNESTKTMMYTKGAPDMLLNRVTKVYDNGTVVPVNDEYIKNIKQQNENMARKALRVLAIAFKELPSYKHEGIENEEQDLVFVGLVGMIDPPREEAKDAVAVCKKAGIRVVMITGDHKITAAAIGSELGIIDAESKAIDGKEINNLSDEELRELVKEVSVFARVSPEHKVRLVDAVKANGNIAAMTGDGVNDAPALKRADIGVAMGITGTDVSKEAADMILTDDNFATIVSAVEEGRTIYSNIRKFVGYLLSCNVGEILIVFIAMLIFGESPLLPIQLLLINLVTDAFPAFALGMEEKEKGIMDKKPRNPKASIIDKKMFTSIIIQSIALAVAVLCSYAYGRSFAPDNIYVAETFCFITIVTGELFRAYAARSEDVSIFKMKIFANSFLNKSVLLSMALLLLIVYVPFLQNLFHTEALDIVSLLIALAFALIPILGGELAKLLSKVLHK